MMENNQLKYDESAGKLLSAYMILYSLNILFQTVIKIPLISQNSTYLFGALFLFIFIALFFREKKTMNMFVIAEFIVCLLIVFTILRYNGYTSDIFARCMWTIVFCVPLLASLSYINNINNFILKTKYVCIIVIAIMIFISINSTRIGGSGEYNMAVGYTLLFPTVCCITLIRDNRLFILPSVAGFVVILLYGSRGPIGCIGIFLIMFILFGLKSNSRKGLFLKVIAILFIVSLFVFEEEIMKSIATFISGHNISSRNLSYFLSNRLFADSGRGSIIQEAYNQINNKPLIGWGIAGDIICLNQYPHRLDVELMIDFGYIVGTILCIIILYYVISGLINSREHRVEYLCLFASGLVPLFFSHSYLSEPFFWAFIGLCISIARKNYSVGKIVFTRRK